MSELQDTDFEGLADAMDRSGLMADAFSDRLSQMTRKMADGVRDLGAIERGFSGGVRRAFDNVILDGSRLSDALQGLAQSMSKTVYSAAMRPVTDQLGGLLAQGVNGAVGALMPFANGGAFTQGRVMPFAKGGVVSQATTFPMRGDTGLMGEAGPEAIMPLTRGPDGSLGVRSAGGAGSVQVTMNISTPDVEGFRRSRSQIVAQLSRALSHAQRNA